MKMTKVKLRALVACGILLLGTIAIGILITSGAISGGVGGASFALLFGVAFFSVSRLRCPNCNKRLTEMYPLGGLLLLWLAKEKCRNCGTTI